MIVERLKHIFVGLPRLAIGVLMLAMVAINFSNVVGRHVFAQPLFWAEEIMVLMMVWSVFLGAIAVTFSGRHLRMDLFSAGLGRPWRDILNTVTTVVMLGVITYIANLSLDVVQLMQATGRVSDAAKYPAVVQHSAVLVGLVAMVAAVAVRIRAYLKGEFE